jgi:rubrerythrin
MENSSLTIKHKKGQAMATNENLIKVFEYALNQEQTGKGFFEYSLQRMTMGAAVSAFKRLIEEEQKHIVFITGILERLKSGAELEPEQLQPVVLDPTNYFESRAKSEFLQQCIEGSMIPDVTVFNTAWLIEKDLSEFYERMAAQTEGKAKDAFLMLSRWEKAHEAFFREYRDKLSDVYSRIPWGG